MKRVFAALGIVGVVVAVSLFLIPADRANAQKPGKTKDKPVQEKKAASLWMKHKLLATQKILEGMTSADFDLIAKNAESMSEMSYLEAWVNADKPDYRAELHAFTHATSEIITAAKAKNLDAVTLGFNQLTISCTQCHRIVRDKAKD